jgi:hypothetical protein
MNATESGTAEAVLLAAARIVRCNHRGEARRVLVSVLRHKDGEESPLYARRCDGCGAIETPRSPWVAPKLVRDLTAAMGEDLPGRLPSFEPPPYEESSMPASGVTASGHDTHPERPSPVLDDGTFAAATQAALYERSVQSLLELRELTHLLAACVRLLPDVAAGVGGTGQVVRLRIAANVIADFADTLRSAAESMTPVCESRG